MALLVTSAAGGGVKRFTVAKGRDKHRDTTRTASLTTAVGTLVEEEEEALGTEEMAVGSTPAGITDTTEVEVEVEVVEVEEVEVEEVEVEEVETCVGSRRRRTSDVAAAAVAAAEEGTLVVDRPVPHCIEVADIVGSVAVVATAAAVAAVATAAAAAATAAAAAATAAAAAAAEEEAEAVVAVAVGEEGEEADEATVGAVVRSGRDRRVMGERDSSRDRRRRAEGHARPHTNVTAEGAGIGAAPHRLDHGRGVVRAVVAALGLETRAEVAVEEEEEEEEEGRTALP